MVVKVPGVWFMSCFCGKPCCATVDKCWLYDDKHIEATRTGQAINDSLKRLSLICTQTNIYMTQIDIIVVSVLFPMCFVF